MKWPVVLTASVLLAGQTISAGLTRDIVHGIRRDDTTDRALRRRAAIIMNSDSLEKRTAVAGSTTLNSSAWEAETVAACTTALAAATSTDPSGMAVCYNLPTLDSTTGTFEADMRLFRIADATGNFAGLSSDGIQVGLSYSGASVQPMNSSSLAKREVHSLISWPTIKRADGLDSRANTPVLTQSYMFKGQINAAMMTANMTDAEFEAAVLPTVTLTAVSAQGVAAFNSSLNSTQAAFLVGAFSGKAATTSGSTAAAAAADASSTSTSASTSTSTSTVFILPGTKILIFPIGAIITGTWTLLGVATVMYGTFGRIQFRDQYRRQAARQNAGSVSRI